MAKILLVDDQPSVVRLLQVILSREEYTLLTAHDGLQALHLIETERPDLVVLDISMPGLDGLRVLNRVRMDPELRCSIVVMLTAKDDPADVALGLDVGADYYLTKPFRPDDVASLVKRALEVKAASEQAKTQE